MEQPLFSCAKCFKNFPQSEMSRSGQACKNCNPHHSTFKQCEFCKSDFKHYIYGTVCPRCQSLKSKYGEPLPCSICRLKMAFGNALVCQRCLHYRARFGEPRECQTCGKLCAFLKDVASRQKVDGQVLCWVCTYNFKLVRSRERSDHGRRRIAESASDTSQSKRQRCIDSHSKRVPSENYNSLKQESNLGSSQLAPSAQTQSLDSVYNEHLLTISQLQDELKSMRRQLAAKENDLFAKDRTIAELRSDLIEMKGLQEDRISKVRSSAQIEQDRLLSVIYQLKKEKAAASQGLRKRKSTTNLLSTSGLRYSTSSVALFNPDSPLPPSSIITNKSVNKSKLPGPASAVKHAKQDSDFVVEANLSDPCTPEVPIDANSNGDVVSPLKSDLDLFIGDEMTEIAPAGHTEIQSPSSPSSPVKQKSVTTDKQPSSTSSSPSVSSGSSSVNEVRLTVTDVQDPLGLDTPTTSEEDDD